MRRKRELNIKQNSLRPVKRPEVIYLGSVVLDKLGFDEQIKSLLLSGEGGPLAVDEVVEL